MLGVGTELSKDRERRVTVGDMSPGTLYSKIRILYQGFGPRSQGRVAPRDRVYLI